MGDKGEKGDSGFIGTDGAKGDKGNTGDKGERGAEGEEGFKGDKGQRGKRGKQGEKGESGQKGSRGKSGKKGKRGMDGVVASREVVEVAPIEETLTTTLFVSDDLLNKVKMSHENGQVFYLQQQNQQLVSLKQLNDRLMSMSSPKTLSAGCAVGGNLINSVCKQMTVSLNITTTKCRSTDFKVECTDSFKKDCTESIQSVEEIISGNKVSVLKKMTVVDKKGNKKDISPTCYLIQPIPVARSERNLETSFETTSFQCSYSPSVALKNQVQMVEMVSFCESSVLKPDSEREELVNVEDELIIQRQANEQLKQKEQSNQKKIVLLKEKEKRNQKIIESLEQKESAEEETINNLKKELDEIKRLLLNKN